MDIKKHVDCIIYEALEQEKNGYICSSEDLRNAADFIIELQDRLTAAESEVTEFAEQHKIDQNVKARLMVERDQLRAQVASFEAAMGQDRHWFRPVELTGYPKGTYLIKTYEESDPSNIGPYYAAPIMPEQTTPAESVLDEHEIDLFSSIASSCGDTEKFKDDSRLRLGCFAYFIHGLNYSLKVEQVSGGGEQKSKLIMDFVGHMIGAYSSNFVSTPVLTLGQLYQVARNYSEDTFKIKPISLADEMGEEFAKLCNPVIHPSPNNADVPSVPTEEMIEIGVSTLKRGADLFGENLEQIISNVWEDMYEASLPPLKDE